MTLEPPGAVPLDDALAMTRFPASTSTIRAANVILTDICASRHTRRIVTRSGSSFTGPAPARNPHLRPRALTHDRVKGDAPAHCPRPHRDRSAEPASHPRSPRSRSRRQTPGRDKAITPRTSKAASDAEPVENRVTPRFHDTGRTARHAQGAQDDHRSRRNSAQRPPDGQADTPNRSRCGTDMGVLAVKWAGWGGPPVPGLGSGGPPGRSPVSARLRGACVVDAWSV